MDGFPLEVIAEGEIAQHLKIGAMTGGLADVLNITGADALLAGADPVTGGLHLAGEVGFHGCHAGVNQQQALVSIWHQGKAGQPKMAL